MSKEEEIYLDGYDFFFWKYEEQTKIKHFVLNSYLDIWIKIVGSNSKLNYCDCHGGCGAYYDNDEIFWGSPILAANTIISNKINLDRQVNLIVFEDNKKNVKNLRNVFKYHNLNQNNKWHIIHSDYDSEINNLLDRINDNLAPTFFFVDPFGYKIKYSTLQRIMKIPKSEIFLNFMFNSINRAVSNPSQENIIDELYGTANWRSANSLSGIKREETLIELFRNQLKNCANHVFPFRMSFPNKKRTYYYLFHLTNYYKGCVIMKSAFAKFNFGRVEYRGPIQHEMTFADLESFKVANLGNFLVQRYAGSQKSFKKIMIDIIDEVPFLEKEIREALKELEKKHLINVTRLTSKTSRGLSEDDICLF